MKNKYNFLKITALVLVTIFALSSCGKDNSDVKSEKEAKVRIEIEHTGDFEYYGGGLTASSSLTRDLKMVTLSGADWADQETSANVTVYAKDYVKIPKVISFETVAPGTFLQFGYVASVSSSGDEILNPLEVAIKYYLDGKLVKTEHYDPVGQGGVPASYLGRIEVSDY